MGIEKMLEQVPKGRLEVAQQHKERMLRYRNPVEFVNNMYGCHPNDGSGDYFQVIYKG